MRIEYLGTAAAEGLPAVFCNCPTCREAKKKGGKNIRTRSQIMIDGKLLIDFPMDTYMHMLKNRLDLSAIEHIFITHSHMDHCYPQDLCMHGAPFAHDMTCKKLNIYGNSAVLGLFETQTKREMKPEALGTLSLNRLSPFSVVSAGEYEVTALPAVHTIGEECLIYLVEKNGKRYLHMNDTGIISGEVYDKLLGKRVDLISFDCTYGPVRKGPGRHMGLPDAENEREKLISRGIADDNTKYVLTHFSHNGGMDYDSIAILAENHGFIASYDGMVVDI